MMNALDFPCRYNEIPDKVYVAKCVLRTFPVDEK